MYTYIIAMYMYIFTLTQSCVNVLGDVSVSAYTKIIYKITMSLGLLSPPNPSFNGICKVATFYQIWV
jgi:hypothetical protein